MKLDNMRPVLVVDDVMRSLHFWVDRLGFTKSVEAHDASYAAIVHGSLEILLRSKAAFVESAPHLAGQNFCTTLYIEVEDVETIVPVIADTDVVVPLRKTAYGMHEVFVREPGGHIVGFASALPER